MRKRWFMVSVIFLLLSFMLVGCGVAQEQYDAVVADLDRAQHETQSVKAELEAAQAKVSELTSNLGKSQIGIETIKTELEKTEAENSALANNLDKSKAELSEAQDSLVELRNDILLVCSTAPKEASVEVPIDDFLSQNHISKQVEVPVGGLFTVTLGSNPTTGFQWSEEAEISDPSVLKQVCHEFIGPESEPPPPPGTPGQEVWTFTALKAGTTTVSMEYSRPWEGGEKGEWTFNLVVTVK